MNFVLDMDIRSFANSPAPEAVPASPAPTPGGLAFAQNLQALFYSDADLPSANPDTLGPRNDMPLPFSSIVSAPEAEIADNETSAAGILVPISMTAAAQAEPAPEPAPERESATASLPEDAPARQSGDASSPATLLVPVTINELLVRHGVTVREPKPGLDQAAKPDADGMEPAAASAAPGPAPAAPSNIPSIQELASLSSERAGALPAETIPPITEQVRSDSQPSLPAPAAALSIASAPAQIMAPVPSVAAAPVAQAVLVALPSELPDIVTRAIQDKPADRISVQLDPPELGRVSIDFRFEGQTLQHVTITAETPEAVRQLRLMHGELLEALEQNGLGQKDMTFQQQTPQERQEQAFAERAQGGHAPPLAAPQPTILSIPSQAALKPGRLDIRL